MSTTKTTKTKKTAAPAALIPAITPAAPAALIPAITPAAPVPVPDEDKVELSLPRACDREEQSLFISVNGVNYLLPRGKTSLVPKAVAAEYHRHLRALDGFDATRSALESK